MNIILAILATLALTGCVTHRSRSADPSDPTRAPHVVLLFCLFASCDVRPPEKPETVDESE